jgi:hypothetical protein
VVLSDPLKDSSRSQESWSSFLLKLRTLLLMSFTKNLGRFEDDMRTLREKRTQPGWSFCEYFMVQVCGMQLAHLTPTFILFPFLKSG